VIEYDDHIERVEADLWARDEEILQRVLRSRPREHVSKVRYHFADLCDSCDSDIEAAMCVGLCSVMVGDMKRSRDYIYPQFRVDPFRLDFMVWPDPEGQPLNCVGVECDGAAYHTSPSQRDKDAWRENKIFEEHNVPIVRFAGKTIWWDAIACAQAVLSKAEYARRAGQLAKPELFDRGGSWSLGELLKAQIAKLKREAPDA
jgi:hypothetical protein